MRLFGIVNGKIDADDRAEWLTPPFGTPPAAPPLPNTYEPNDGAYRRQPNATTDINRNYRRLFGQGSDYT